MMIPRCSGRWFRAILILGTTFLGLGRAARAQSLENPKAYYYPRSRFGIPCDLRPGESRVDKIALHVSTDEGRTWKLHDTVPSTTRQFDFEAYHDGWYWFVSQTIDSQGRRVPAQITRNDLGLKVYVDTVRPAVTLRGQAKKDGTIGVEWNLRDATLDLATLALQFRARGGTWRTVRIANGIANGQTTWNPGVNGDVEVRLEVKDKAGNLGGATTFVRRDGGGSNDAPGVATIRKVNSKTFNLNCQLADVGDSGVSEVEIWITSDRGANWQRYKSHRFNDNYEYKTYSKPHEVTVQDEGLFGLSLIAKSGVGLGEKPPRPGDQPQVWVEVDTTDPVVKIDNVIVGEGADVGKVIITWTASDKNLARRPITISYRDVDRSEWIAVPNGKQIESSGRFVWQVDGKVPYQFFLQVEASDEAGNHGNDTTKDTVKVDLAKPRVRVLDVDVGRPRFPN